MLNTRRLIIFACFIVIAAVLAIIFIKKSTPQMDDEKGGWCYNSSFEIIENGFPTGWERKFSHNQPGRDNFIRPTKDAFDGRTAIRMKADDKTTAILNAIPTWHIPLIKGKVSFRYKIISSSCGGKNLTFSVIPLNAERSEGGASRVVFTAPKAHVRDGKWHKGEISFDYLNDPAVTRVILSSRINDTDVKGNGEWLIDDINLERANYVLTPSLIICGAAPAQGIITTPGKEINGSCTVVNKGVYDARKVVIKLNAWAVERGRAVKIDMADQTITGLLAGETKSVKWKCRCPKSGWLHVEASAIASYFDSETKLESWTSEVKADSWTPIRTKFASMPANLDRSKKSEATGARINQVYIDRTRKSLIIGDGVRRIMLDCRQSPAIMRFFINNGKWHEVARSPWLVKIDDGYSNVWTADFNTAKLVDGIIRISPVSADGTSLKRWKSTIELKYDRELGLFDLACRAKPFKTTDLKLFQFPYILVGEGTSGAEKQGALFPGVEFLTGNERSSGTRDLTPPASNRWSPHPFAVTIPLMTVALKSGTVGLEWDPLSRWCGNHRYIEPVFASPNFMDDQKNHKLSLFVPSVPEFVPENGLMATRRFDVDDEIDVRAGIILEPNAGALDVVQMKASKILPSWKLPETPRNYQDEMKLCAQAFLSSIWDEGFAGWEPVKGWDPKPDIQILLAALRLSREITDKNLSAKLKQHAKRVVRVHKKEILDLDVAFAAGGIMESLAELKKQAEEAMKEQGKQGEWTFQPSDKNHAKLGKTGDSTVGICAMKIPPLLRYTEVTGDQKALAAGIKGLKYMDRFVIPAGAQIWECPLYAPDVFAAAKAVQAYMTGYRITGNKHYLEKAKYWACTGLPFIYLWNAPDRSVMKGASIPIFGGTFFARSWIGVPVQWNGLAYADAILDLAPYDASFDWKKIAQGITLSAMRQQAESGENIGLYPDFWTLASNRAGDPWLSPHLILNNNWKLRGNERLKTTRIGKMVVTTAADAQIKFVDGKIIVTFTRPPLLDSDYILISGTSKPVSVVSSPGSVLKEVSNLAKVGSGWTFDNKHKWLAVKTTHSGKAQVAITSGK